MGKQKTNVKNSLKNKIKENKTKTEIKNKRHNCTVSTISRCRTVRELWRGDQIRLYLSAFLRKSRHRLPRIYNILRTWIIHAQKREDKGHSKSRAKRILILRIYPKTIISPGDQTSQNKTKQSKNKQKQKNETHRLFRVVLHFPHQRRLHPSNVQVKLSRPYVHLQSFYFCVWVFLIRVDSKMTVVAQATGDTYEVYLHKPPWRNIGRAELSPASTKQMYCCVNHTKDILIVFITKKKKPITQQRHNDVIAPQHIWS